MSAARHRDPNSSGSGRPSGTTPRGGSNATPRGGSNATPRTSVSKASSMQEETTPRRASGSGGANLIVARGLYEVLEKERQAQPLSPRKRAISKGPASRPNFLFCYLCGQQFGSASLPIHQPQCYVKKMIEWERMDPVKRGPKPLNPEEHEKQMKRMQSASGMEGKTASPKHGGKLHGKHLDRFNEMQIQHFNDHMLLKCDNCGRTFLPDRLEVHQRSCKPGSAGASRPVQRRSNAPPSASSPRSAAAAPEALSPTQPASPPNAFAAVPFAERPIRSRGNSDATTTSASDARLAPRGTSTTDSPPMEKDPLAATRAGEEVMDAIAELSAAENAGSPSVYMEELDDSAEEAAARRPSTSEPPKRAAHTPRRRPISAEPRSNAVVAPGGAAAAVAAALSAVHEDGDGEERGAETPREHKIQLNNVSRFKNVKSRIKMELERQKAEGHPRCRHCSRTFLPDRLEKHEGVCVERNKPPQPLPHRKLSNTPTVVKAAPTESGQKKSSTAVPPPPQTTTQLAKASAPTETQIVEEHSAGGETPSKVEVKETRAKSSDSVETSKLHFCFECGTKLRPDGQRFCGECGTKLS